MDRLPGGLWRDGRLFREYTLLPMNGVTELRIAEALISDAPTPCVVTEVLAAVVERVGDEPMTTDLARDLSVADRQYLMRRLKARYEGGGSWSTLRCSACSEPFDLKVPSEMPVKPAEPGYPFVEVEMRGSRSRFRIPNGGDQEVLAGVDDPGAAMELLLKRCALDGEAALDPREIARVDEAMEFVFPEVADRISASCPECGNGHEIATDPYDIPAALPEALFAEIHELAMNYHWSENAILEMPRERRRMYLRLIDEAQGVRGGEPLLGGTR